MTTTETETVPTETNCYAAAYDVDRVREAIPGWGSLDDREKSRQLHDLEPDSLGASHNVTTEALTQYHADGINPEATTASLEATHMALGNDDGTPPARDNQALNNEIERLSYTDAVERSEEVAIVVFVDSATLNGESILEGGLVDNTENTLLNHAFWSDPEGRLDPKTSKVVANLIIELRWGDGDA